MLNPDDLIDACIAHLLTNADFVASLADADPANLIPYYHDDAYATNFEQAVVEQGRGTALLAWRGTRTGVFYKAEATKHDFALFLKSIGRASNMTVPLFSGICTSTGLPFRKSTVHARCYPPYDSMQIIPQPIFISQGYGLYDTLPATFTLTEKGIDV